MRLSPKPSSAANRRLACPRIICFVQEIPYWLRVAESLAAVAMPVIIASGGIFAYYKFFRQGEHDPRLQPTVTGEATMHGGMVYIVATVAAQNTGQVDAVLDLEGSGLETFLAEATVPGWTPHTTSDVFDNHDIVQPGETIEDQILLEMVDEGEIAVGLRLTVAETAKGHSWEAVKQIVLVHDEGGKADADG